MRLTQKQETFCLKYFEIGNATEAALIAGYSSKTARFIASINLTKLNIKTRLDQLRQKAEDDSVMSVLERKQRLSEIGRADIPDFLTEDGIKVEGQPNTGGVAEITTKTKVFRKGGEPVVFTNLKLHSPIQAIDTLNKMDKLYTEGTPITIDNRKVTIIVSSEEAKTLTERLLEGEGTE